MSFLIYALHKPATTLNQPFNGSAEEDFHQGSRAIVDTANQKNKPKWNDGDYLETRLASKSIIY
ncbi:MAG: hypothetical protein Altm1KO_31220 [Alteromonas macleodii]